MPDETPPAADVEAARQMAQSILKCAKSIAAKEGAQQGAIYATEMALSVLAQVSHEALGVPWAREWAKTELVNSIEDHFDGIEQALNRIPLPR